jgi:salicylate hydroxylase
MARANKTRFHLSDGPEQQARDTLLATRGDRTIEALGWLYGHDASAIDGNFETDRR